jgi:hypothetical protein
MVFLQTKKNQIATVVSGLAGKTNENIWKIADDFMTELVKQS